MNLTESQKTFFTNEYSDFWPFIEKFDFERAPIFHHMEQQYRELGVHSIDPWCGRLLNFLVRFGSVKTVLEFGTATGYSTFGWRKDCQKKAWSSPLNVIKM